MINYLPVILDLNGNHWILPKVFFQTVTRLALDHDTVHVSWVVQEYVTGLWGNCASCYTTQSPLQIMP